MIGLLGNNRLAAGTDHGDLPWAAKHGSRPNSLCDRSITAGSAAQHGEQDCASCGLIWTVLRYTRITFTTYPEAASKLLRHLPVEEMLKVYTPSCGVSNVDAAAGW